MASSLSIRFLYAMMALTQAGCIVFAQGKLYMSSANPSVCTGFIFIAGNTNVNRFEFDMEFNQRQVIAFDKVNHGSYGSRYIEIPIPVKNFHSNNLLIYNDFLKLLDAETYPYIKISIGYEQLNQFINGTNNTIPKIGITIAGVEKNYTIACRIVPCETGYIYVTGTKNIRLTDFNLNPPEKFQGLIKVRDEVIINFGFIFLIQHTV